MTDQIAPDTDPDTLPAALVELRQARAEIARLCPFVDMADQAARAAERMRTMQGRCPACRWTTLFLGDGGHVTCSRSECPRPDLVNELIGEIADARTHRGYTFCDQLVGHVNMTAFAKKSTEKITAVAHRTEAVAYANEQKQRAEAAEARIEAACALHQPIEGEGGPYCDTCTQEEEQPRPVGWWVPFPCPTVTALTETQEPS
ncbi:DUF6085 family protein [Streptomyces sp. NBC_01239]|uniref:DUF6085 family protein n=1 Tax=Streptomyces sp. NBC_01239 TaxID=2903792 RepID=UPI002259A47E|nr:DUF6085 family protein [Streptomyces sp. NBC_01239]MCX4809027.1 DUF6085 family protein [Streptomyces sp. NBC_01239]MCX4818155.1 DUF6085 family protein [Streptomyces sp. NBC_01239]